MIVQNMPGKKLDETLISEGKATAKQVSQALRKQAERVTAEVLSDKIAKIVEKLG
jgi:hypothetical protein